MINYIHLQNSDIEVKVGTLVKNYQIRDRKETLTVCGESLRTTIAISNEPFAHITLDGNGPDIWTQGYTYAYNSCLLLLDRDVDSFVDLYNPDIIWHSEFGKINTQNN